MLKWVYRGFGWNFCDECNGYLALLTVIGVPLALISFLICIYQIKRNSEIQVDQNKRVIGLLENRKTD